MIKGPSRDGLVYAGDLGKGLLRHAAVFELGQQHLAVLRHERARCIAVVRLLSSLSVHRCQEVRDEDRRLRCDCRGGLGCRETRCIACGPDVGVLLVLGGGLVYVHQSCIIGQRTVLDERVRAHFGDSVQEIKVYLGLVAVTEAREGRRVTVN